MQPPAPGFARPLVRLSALVPARVAEEVRGIVLEHWRSVGRMLGAETRPPEADGRALFFIVEALTIYAQTGATKQFLNTPEASFNVVVRALFHPPYHEFARWRHFLPRDLYTMRGVMLLAALGRLNLVKNLPVDRAILHALAGTAPPTFEGYGPDEDIDAAPARAWLAECHVPGFPTPATPRNPR